MSGGLLITGAGGQLGHALAGLAARRRLEFTAVGRPEFEFSRPETLASCLRQARPAVVLNAAAYTAVDAAERDVAAAEQANHHGPAVLAALCAEADIALLHVSTDYVFDGLKGAPYTEDDTPDPAGVYGRSKRAGEVAILQSAARAVILRTSWVYSAHGGNFARTMLNAARRGALLRVVSDQKGAPTAAGDLAAAMLDIAAMLQAGWRDAYRGIYHATSAGETTWHGFACAIFEAAARFGLPMPAVEAIGTVDWPTPAKRPPDSRLDCTRLARRFGCRLPHWRDSLPGIVERLLRDEAA